MADLLRLRSYGRAADPLGGGGVAPPVPAEEESSLLSDLGERTLGGLSYVGKVADKTFGGRAIRGLLGGNLREGLSILPGSDTLGLTNEADTVTGRQLAENAGWVDKGDPNSFDLGDLAGIGLEIGLDPSTYLSFGAGAATKLGKLGQKVAPAFRGSSADRIAGYVAREGDVSKFANLAGISEGAARQRLGLQLSDNLLPQKLEQAAQAAGLEARPQRVLNAAGDALEAHPQGATPLSGALAVGTPFGIGGYSHPLLTGQTGQTVARYLPLAAAGRLGEGVSSSIEGLTGFNPARSLRAAFDTPSKGLTSAAGQEVATHVATPQEKLYARAGLADTAALSQELGAFRGSPDLATLAGRRASLLQEGADASQYGRREMGDIEQRLLAAGVEPADITRLDASARTVAAAQQAALPAQWQRGVNAPPLDDIVDYSLRQKVSLPRQPGESLWTYAVRTGQANAARSASTGQRDPIFRYVPGGQDQVNSWVQNPQLVDLARQQNPQAQQQILRDLMAGSADVAATPRYQKAAGGLLDTGRGRREIDAKLGELLQVGPQPRAVLDAVPEEVKQQFAEQLARRTLTKQSKRLADYLSTLPDARVQAGLYSNDIVGRAQEFANRQAKVLSTADAATEAIGRNLVPHTADAGTTHIDSILGGLNMGRAENGVSVAKRELADRLNVPISAIDSMGVPRELAADLLKMNTAWQNPGELRPALAAWDYLTQAFKTGVTTPFPAFHVRNFTDAMTGKLRGKALGAEAEAYTLHRGHPMSEELANRLFGLTGPDAAQKGTDLLARELVANPATYNKGSIVRDTMGSLGQTLLSDPTPYFRASKNSLAADVASGVGQLVYRDPLTKYNEARGAGSSVARSALGAAGELAMSPLKAGAAVGNQVENFNRISHFLALRKQGYEAANAAEGVAKFQRDYSDLSNFEKQVMRRIAPFYSFSRRNAASLIDEASTDPARLMGLVRGATGTREPGSFLPPYLAEGATLPLGSNEDGSQRYVSSFGLPFEDELVKSLGNLAHGDLSRALQGALGQAQPYLKAPIEQAFGRQLFSGRRLDELKPSPTLSALLGNDTLARQATQLLANTPAARSLSTTDRLQDDRKGTASSLVNLFSGARVQDVDREAQQPVANRRLLEDQLRGQPGIRSADTLFLSKLAVDQGQVSPETLRLYRAYLDQQKAIQENTDKKRHEAGL